MNSVMRSIPLERLVAHPGNPNRMSKARFNKLVRNIEQSGRYEPLVVRRCPGRRGYYQIINGHHRKLALEKLGFDCADCVVWDVNDEQTDVLLATLNRLGGLDEPGRKMQLLKRLSEKHKSRELAKLVPLRAKQIEQLTSLANREAVMRNLKSQLSNRQPKMPTAFVFFLDDEQQQILEEALSRACANRLEKTKAQKRAAAITNIAERYLRSVDLIRNPDLQELDSCLPRNDKI